MIANNVRKSIPFSWLIEEVGESRACAIVTERREAREAKRRERQEKKTNKRQATDVARENFKLWRQEKALRLWGDGGRTWKETGRLITDIWSLKDGAATKNSNGMSGQSAKLRASYAAKRILREHPNHELYRVAQKFHDDLDDWTRGVFDRDLLRYPHYAGTG